MYITITKYISFFLICRPTLVTAEQIVGALYKTRFLAEQLQFTIHYKQSDDLRSKLSEFLVECMNITKQYCQIMMCPSKVDMFFIGGQNIKSQIVTLAEMVVQNINYIKNQVTKMPNYQMEKSQQVLWQITVKINRKLASYLNKVEYWIY